MHEVYYNITGSCQDGTTFTGVSYIEPDIARHQGKDPLYPFKIETSDGKEIKGRFLR